MRAALLVLLALLPVTASPVTLHNHLSVTCASVTGNENAQWVPVVTVTGAAPDGTYVVRLSGPHVANNGGIEGYCDAIINVSSGVATVANGSYYGRVGYSFSFPVGTWSLAYSSVSHPPGGKAVATGGASYTVVDVCDGGGAVDTTVNFNVAISPINDHVTNFAIATTGDCSGQVTLEVDGVAVGLTSLTGGLGAQIVGDHTGHSVVWKKAGVTIGSSTVAAYSFVGGGSPEFPDGYWASDNSGPAVTCTAPPTPTPSPTPTPTATPPPTPTPGPTPAATVIPQPSIAPPIPGGGGPGGEVTGNVTVENPNDFYAPMKRAFEEAGNSVPVEYPVAGGFTDNDYGRGKLDDLAGAVDANSEKATAVVAGAKNMVQPLKDKVNTLPTSFGDTNHWDLGTAFYGFHFDITTAAFDFEISILRAVLKWCLTIAFVVLVIRSLTYQN